MAKLVKHKSYNVKGTAKVFTYSATISKKVIEEAGWNGEEQIKVYAKDGKIVIEREL